MHLSHQLYLFFFIFFKAAEVVHPDAVGRPDGVVDLIERPAVSPPVRDDFNRCRSSQSISAVLPEGAQEIDLQTAAPPSEPSPGAYLEGENRVKDFIDTLLQYGGYSETVDILVNLTSLGAEIAKLVSEGCALTVLAPNDEAMEKLTAEQLRDPGSPERIINYHILPEYQTEESMYNAVRRSGKVWYDTMNVPHKVAAAEADGTVKFGHGNGSSHLIDADIYADGRISVQGIDGVLFPPETKTVAPARRMGGSV
ncbi:fasciclin-like arabinogalactan protein 16 [Malania oleifera]|uniref:fasciclin-like arabinogalactan protein 16 n=1 Tax=Malania oleifera TaxID=397392 RepID=UPI0025AEBB40|nr:fasciclin-like arabinogalactan protein 16 [Malania oleifera]